MKKQIIVLTLASMFLISMGPGLFASSFQDTTAPEITIENPTEGYFHLSGIKLFQTPIDLLGDTIGLGGFRVRPVQATITDDVDSPENITVELITNDVKERDMMYNPDSGYFEGQWIGIDLGTFTMKIIAEDSSGNSAEETMTVWYFCFVPEI